MTKKIRTFSESITTNEGVSVAVNVAVILEEQSVVAYAVAEGNRLSESEVSSEPLGDEHGDIQELLFLAIKKKVKTFNDADIRNFINGEFDEDGRELGKVGIRYVFDTRVAK